MSSYLGDKPLPDQEAKAVQYETWCDLSRGSDPKRSAYYEGKALKLDKEFREAVKRRAVLAEELGCGDTKSHGASKKDKKEKKLKGGLDV